jgi:hypothetical protein
MNLKNTLQLEKHFAKGNTNTCEEHNTTYVNENTRSLEMMNV